MFAEVGQIMDVMLEGVRRMKVIREGLIEPEAMPYDFKVEKKATTYQVYNKAGIRKWGSTYEELAIKEALDSLKTGRTYPEKVLLKGEFPTLDYPTGNVNCIDLISQTILEIAGKITLADNVDKSIIGCAAGNQDKITVRGGIIDCNGANQASGYGIFFDKVFKGVVNSVEIFNAKQINVFITNYGRAVTTPENGNTIKNCGSPNTIGCGGFIAWSDSHFTQILNNRYYCSVASPAQNAFHIRDASHCLIQGNEARGATDIGFEVEGWNEDVIGTRVIGNVALYSVHHGFYTHTISGTTGKVIGLKWIGNVSELNERNGFSSYVEGGAIEYVTAKGNTARNNSQEGAGTYDGIVLTLSHAKILGNDCYDDQATKTQKYGIRMGAGSDYFIIIGNDCVQNQEATNDILYPVASANNEVAHNFGRVGTF